MANAYKILGQVADASANDVDRVFTGCFSHQMGPLATADLIGLDTIRDSLLVLKEEYSDTKYQPHPLLEKMISSGKLGRKSGEGFFNHK